MGFFGKGKAPRCDGNSADWHKPHIEQTGTIGAAVNLTASARCGGCGTSTPITGRPGQTVNSFTCRSCRATCVGVNGGRGYTFPSPN